MPKKIEQPLENVNIRLFEGDRQTLQRFYPPPIGYNMAIRTIVHDFCKRLLEKESRQSPGAFDVGTLDAELSDILGTAGAGASDADGQAG